MKSQITHEDINEAIIQLIRQRYAPAYLEGKEITVELTAGRVNGNSASIDIKPMNHKYIPQCEVIKDAASLGLPVPDPIPDDEPQEIGDVTEVEPTIPDDTSVLHTDF